MSERQAKVYTGQEWIPGPSEGVTIVFACAEMVYVARSVRGIDVVKYENVIVRTLANMGPEQLAKLLELTELITALARSEALPRRGFVQPFCRVPVVGESD